MVPSFHDVVTYIRWNLSWFLTSSLKRSIGGFLLLLYITLIRLAISCQDATSSKDSGNIRHMEWAVWHALEINHLACINYQRVGKFMNFEVHWVINHSWGWGLKRRFPHPRSPSLYSSFFFFYSSSSLYCTSHTPLTADFKKWCQKVIIQGENGVGIDGLAWYLEVGCQPLAFCFSLPSLHL